MQRFAKVADQSAPNRLVNMMFLKGSFYFPSGSNLAGLLAGDFFGLRRSPCAARLCGLSEIILLLQNFAHLRGKDLRWLTVITLTKCAGGLCLSAASLIGYDDQLRVIDL
ncbi:hypothetical protein M8S86_14120 [Enterobacter hormaechei]|nr:hypothetical protein [Enterobacter hormaechei]